MIPDFKYRNILRWILFIPIAIIANIIGGLFGWFIVWCQTYFEYSSLSIYDTYFSTFFIFFPGSFALVFLGGTIVPNFKKIISITLCVICCAPSIYMLYSNINLCTELSVGIIEFIKYLFDCGEINKDMMISFYSICGAIFGTICLFQNIDYDEEIFLD